MSFLKKNSITKITGVFILLTIIFTIVSQEKWDKPNGVIGADVRGYYAYLPALFIHNDLKFENLEVYKNEKGYEVWTSRGKDGKTFIKYTSGMAIMYSPFFVVTHSLAESLGAKADGFSYPYKIGLIIASLFYLVIGLIFLSKLLLRYFEDRVVSIALLILYLGTNLFEFSTGHLALSHSYSFALITVFLFCSLKWLDAPKLKWAIWMGISGGLMLLIRPIDIIFLSFIIFVNVNSFESLNSRFKLLWNYRLHALIFMAFVMLILLPQLLYYKHVFGKFIYYSYTKEGFFFLEPHLFDTIFSYRNGWLVYSPIMILAIIGFFFTKRYSKQFTWFSPIAFLVYFYIISSWWCWWYAGFGNRAFINVYPILAVPLCAFIAFALSRKLLVRLGFHVVVLALILFNFFQSYQFENGIIHWGYMSKEAYWDAWGRSHVSQLQELYLRKPDLNHALEGRDVISVPVVDTLLLIDNSFEKLSPSDTSSYPFAQNKVSYTGKKSLFFDEGTAYMLNTKFNVPKETTHIYISYKLRRSDAIVAVLEGSEEKPFYFLSGDIFEVDNGWEKMEMFAPLPRENKDKPDSLTFYLWNKAAKEIYVDDLEIRCFNVSYKEVER